MLLSPGCYQSIPRLLGNRILNAVAGLFRTGLGSTFWSPRDRQRRPNNSLGLSASVLSMFDSSHLSKVVEGDLAWP
jgi:hypothetical protein